MRPLLAAVLLVLPVAAAAGPLGAQVRPSAPGAVVLAQDRTFPRIFGGGNREERERQASEDALRIQELEDEVRQLTGQVETLTFTVRRLQDELARAGGGAAGAVAEATPAGPGDPAAPLGSTVPSGDLAAGGDGAFGGPGGGFGGTQSAPVDLSALNRGATPDPAPGGAGGSGGAGGAGGVGNAALEEVRQLHDTGRYAMAAERARQILGGETSGPVASDARYRLGEALLAQRDFRGAANSFLENYTADPQGVRAPMSLVRLGTALNGLGETAAACSSLDELFGAYPNLDPAVRAEAMREREAANCA